MFSTLKSLHVFNVGLSSFYRHDSDLRQEQETKKKKKKNLPIGALQSGDVFIYQKQDNHVMKIQSATSRFEKSCRFVKKKQ